MSNRHTIITRAFELKKGDRFIMLGYEYIVRRIDTKIWYTTVRRDKVTPGGSCVMGLKSKQLIQLLINPPDISVPVEIPFELLKYKSNNNGKQH